MAFAMRSTSCCESDGWMPGRSELDVGMVARWPHPDAELYSVGSQCVMLCRHCTATHKDILLKEMFKFVRGEYSGAQFCVSRVRLLRNCIYNNSHANSMDRRYVVQTVTYIS